MKQNALDAFDLVKAFVQDLQVKPTTANLELILTRISVGNMRHINGNHLFKSLIEHGGPLPSHLLFRLNDSQVFLDVIDYLPDNEINMKKEFGSPLLLKAGHLTDAKIAHQVTEKLLQRGSDPNLKPGFHEKAYAPRHYSISLMQALELKRHAMATLLIRYGVVVDEFVRKGLDAEALNFLDHILPTSKLLIAFENSKRIN